MKTLIALAIMLTITPCFASTVKVDDNSLKTTTEKVYTYEDIQIRINQLKAERDGQQNNLNLLNAEIARLEKMIQDTGIKAMPVETDELEEMR
jgi:peptidoglycan hydrolase CwlO-like protein